MILENGKNVCGCVSSNSDFMILDIIFIFRITSAVLSFDYLESHDYLDATAMMNQILVKPDPAL